ncbi:MAG TPA: NrsF family protein, partial [Acidisoma sp.]|nr:NrsF family protein [Acidisoma sp.]
MSDSTDIIGRLAREAGQRNSGAPVAGGFGRVLLLSMLAAFAVGVLLICLAFAGTFDPVRVISSYPFHFKIGTMALLAAGAFLALRHLGIPGSDARIAWAVLPGPVALLLLALFDRSGFPLLGRDAASVPICFFAILGASLP